MAWITSASGDARYDMERVLKRRWPFVQVMLYHCAVQGSEAPSAIADQIARACRDNICEIIVVARGGGSQEDLAAFDDPQVIEAIYNAHLPVVTGIGHEADISLSDLTADQYASTPTAAIEVLTPFPAEQVWYFLEHSRDQITMRLNQFIKQQAQKLLVLKQQLLLKDPYLKLDKQLELLKTYKNQLLAMPNLLANYEQKIALDKAKLSLYYEQNIARLYLLLKQQITFLRDKLVSFAPTILQIYTSKIERLRQLMIRQDWKEPLKKGYALIYQDHQLLNLFEMIKQDQPFEVKMLTGILEVKATKQN